ncbi:hypothetical protein [Mangrovicoccus sp. HB161399]|uniref:hypothetical protein n=1 Tax=Mangrovicoccus sp. HB161399 TaxID=2720392 RepID=UPI0015534571|nr:hypothetical protein [Mangrovicoccus sp. HB161399]
MQTGLTYLCLIATMAATPLLALVMSAPAGEGAPVLVVSGSGAEARLRLVAEAGGYPVGPVSAPMATLAASDQPGFAARLEAAGAWFVLDAAFLSTICGANS